MYFIREIFVLILIKPDMYRARIFLYDNNSIFLPGQFNNQLMNRFSEISMRFKQQTLRTLQLYYSGHENQDLKRRKKLTLFTLLF
jgi:hypothetical protein